MSQKEKGFMIMAATARPEPSIRQLLDQVRFDAVTTLNGARILLPGRVLEHAIPAESGRFRPDAPVTAEELERFLTVRLGRSREDLPQQITHGQFFLLADALMGADR